MPHFISKRRALTLNSLLVIILLIMLILFGAHLILSKIQRDVHVILCQKNMRNLGIAMHQYAADNNVLYPTPSKWCDLLVEKTGIRKSKFCCTTTGDSTITTDTPIDDTNMPVQVKYIGDHNDLEGHKKYTYDIAWSHYALNPNAEPNSAPNVVLLFETADGWNQFGGPDLCSTQNHAAYGKIGCNILFNDGRAKFVKPKDISLLNWGKSKGK